MVDVEELMSKIKSGVWSTQDAFDCIKDLEQEYLQSSKTKEWREDYSSVCNTAFPHRLYKSFS